MAISTRTASSGANAFSLSRMMVPTREMPIAERFQEIQAIAERAREESSGGGASLETLATVPHILVNGAEWYRSLGTWDSPGTMVFTVVGDVVRPGYGEIELGTPVREIIDRVGGGTFPGRRVKAVFSGVSNGVLTADHLDAPATYEDLRAAGLDHTIVRPGGLTDDPAQGRVTVGAHVDRRPGQLDGVGRVVGPGAGDDLGLLPADRVDHRLEQRDLLLVGERRRFPGGAAGHETVGFLDLNQIIDQTPYPILVDAVIVFERRNNRNVHPGPVLLCHELDFPPVMAERLPLAREDTHPHRPLPSVAVRVQMR